MKVLLFDDEAAIRKVLSRLLVMNGIEVTAMEEASEAVSLASSLRPHVILMDLELASSSGAEAIRRLKSDSRTRDIPVIVITGRSTKENVLESIEAGASDFMVKSDFRIEEFISRVRALAVRRPSDVPATPETAPLGRSRKRRTNPKTPPPRVLSKEGIDDRFKSEIELQALPSVVAEVVQVAASSRSEAALLAQTIARDPVVAAQVLRVANSAFQALHGPVHTLTEAVARLGFRQIREITIALKLVPGVGDQDRGSALTLLQIWRHSLAVAVLARDLGAALELPAEDSETLFLMGLLHDLGQSFLVENFPEAYSKLVDRSARESRELVDEERRSFGTDHAELTHRILTKWKILVDQSEDLAVHHAGWSRLKSCKNPRFAGVLRAADSLANAAGVGNDGDPRLELIPADLLEGIGIQPERLLPHVRNLRPQVDELSQILFVHGHPGSAPASPSLLLPEGGSAIVVSESAEPLDPLALFLESFEWKLHRGSSLQEVLKREGLLPTFLRARTEGWLREQLIAAKKETRRWKEPPLVVLGDVSIAPDLRKAIKAVGGHLWSDPVSIPRLHALFQKTSTGKKKPES